MCLCFFKKEKAHFLWDHLCRKSRDCSTGEKSHSMSHTHTHFPNTQRQPVESVGIWPKSHITAHHLGPPQADGGPRPANKSKVWWSLCSPHSILSLLLLRYSRLLPGKQSHKPITPAHPYSRLWHTACLSLFFTSFLLTLRPVTFLAMLVT